MGRVYHARDRVSGEDVAVKLLAGGSEMDRARFERESEMLAQLADEDTIVRHVASGVVDGETYIAMEWLPGIDLATHLARSGPLSIPNTIVLARRLARALEAAHARGVVHRDLKPSNVLLVGGEPAAAKLIDFGVARFAQADALTRTGQVVGTPSYMAPEQLRAAATKAEASADIFALGCVVYECLAGERAFDGDDIRVVLAKILFTDIPELRTRRADVPEPLARLVESMLQKDPLSRPRSARLVGENLAAFDAPIVSASSGDAREEVPPSAKEPGQRWVHVIIATPALSTDRSLAEADRLADLAARWEGELEVAADGTAFVVLRGAGQASDRAAGAARCALALSKILPATHVAVAAARSSAGTKVTLSDVFARAVALPAAPGGSVRVDEHVAALLDPRFVTAVREDGVIELLREEPLAQKPRLLLGRPTPTVGRDRELASLRAMLDEVANDGVARATLITADAGVGKSRLRQEVTSFAKERFQLWTARGESMSAGSPLLIAQELLRCAVGRDRSELEARISELVIANDRASVVAFLAHVLGVEGESDRPLLDHARRDKSTLADRIRAAWEAFVFAASGARPVLIILEDLHWGDLPSIKLVDAALRRCRERPFAVLALARPEVLRTFPDLWAERALEHVRLSGLSPRACTSLVKHALGARLSDGAVARIVELCAGNALYLEELIRATKGGAKDVLPSTVLAMVQARLEALAPTLQRALQVGSIFGEVVPLDGMRALLSGDDVDRHVPKLIELELLEKSDVERDAGELRFRHALVREAIYESLEADERATLHLAAARWLETQENRSADPLVLAEHFERGGDRPKTLACLRLAARRLYAAGDSPRAAAITEHALTLGPSDSDAAYLHVLRSGALYWTGQVRSAADAAREGLKSAAAGSKDWYRGLLAILAPLVQSLQIEEFLARVRDLLGSQPTFETAALHTRALIIAGVEASHIAPYGIGRELLEQIEKMAGLVRDEAVLAWAGTARAVTYAFTCRPATGTREAIRAAEGFQRLEDPQALGWARCIEMFGAILLGTWSHGWDLCAARRKHQLFEPTWCAGEAYVNFVRGDLDAAVPAAEEAVAIARANGNELMTGVATHGLARARLWQGRLEEAAALAADSAAALVRCPTHYVAARGVEALVALARGENERALASAKDAIAGFEARCVFMINSAPYAVEAAAYARLGDEEQARRALGRGRDLLFAMTEEMSSDQRACFLRAVPAHVQLLALADAADRSAAGVVAELTRVQIL